MKEGDVYFVEIPMSGGHEQAGLRPAIIVQASGLDKLPTVFIVPLTSKQKAADFPFSFLIEPEQINNLNVTAVAIVFQLRAIDQRRLKNKIRNIGREIVEILKKMLKDIMGI